MKITIAGSIFILLLSCTNPVDNKRAGTSMPLPHADTPGYVWTKLADSAQWKKSYNFQLFNIHDTLWTFHHDGNWYSPDAEHWKKSILPNSISNLAFLDYVLLNDAILGLGHFEGNIEQFEFKPEIYKTTDLIHWQTISKHSNLPGRFFYHPFVYHNQVWIIGGEDDNTRYADIWNSNDGILWVKQKDNLPFGKRSESQIVLLHEKLFLLNNDVWSSTDGLNWQKETDEIVKGEQVYGYSAVVYDDKIWLIGCNRNGQFKSQVFFSSDGKTWQGAEAPWAPRGGVATTVFNNKIYMTGGKYGGFSKDGTTTAFIYYNEIWTLSKR